MAITINGTANTVAGLAVGGLPDGSTDADALASNAVTNVKVADDAIGVAELSATGTASSSTFLRGDNSWATPSDNGKLLQATTTSDTITTGTVSISTAWTDTSIAATITPSATTSKVLISGQMFGEGNAADHLFFWRIKKAISGGATSYIEGGGAGSRKTVFGVFLEGGASDNNSTPTMAQFANYLDSPSTTSAVTYTFQVFYNGAATFYVNRTVGTTDSIAYERGVSYITLMEVGA